MGDRVSISKPPPQPVDREQFERLIATIERFERRFDEFCRVYLNSKFPYGRLTDRWRRSTGTDRHSRS
jgi:hypothetical protein